MTEVEFSKEPLSIGLIAELQPILEQHYKELALYQDIPLKPDFTAYWDAHKANRLRIYLARFHGDVIGYNVIVTQPNAHYSTSKQAAQDILYVLPDHRMEGIGRKLVRYSNEQLKAEGVQVLKHHVKVKHPALGHILETEGAELEEYVYSFRLDKAPEVLPSAQDHMENIKAWEAAQ